jgi:hypothetical protein
MGEKLKKIIAVLSLAISVALASAVPASAIDSYDIKVQMAWGKCLPKKVAGTFKLQTKLSGTSNWVTQGTAKADDGSGGDGSECAKWEYWIMWTPTQLGTINLRVINGSKVFESTTIKITNTGPYAQTQVSYVSVPNMLGSRDGAARSWLQSHGYKFSLDLRSTGGNPKQSCMMSGNNPILRQSPAPGVRVANRFQTWLTIFVDCEWRY